MKTLNKLFIALTLLVLSIGMGFPAHAAPGDTTRVSVATNGAQANNTSNSSESAPSISSDGRYVAFSSLASNLVEGDTNGYRDIFVHDQQTSTTSRVSVAPDETQGNGNSETPSISADGRYVAFYSESSNLVDGDTNGYSDVFVFDRQTGGTTRVSIATNGIQGNNISAITAAAISADGRYVTFASLASNLGSGDTNGYCDIFVHDRQTSITSRITVAMNNMQGNNDSYQPSISADGRYVAFQSTATNLVSDDMNLSSDIFLYDRQTGITTRVSVASNGTQGNSDSYWSSISTNGRYVAFYSKSSNLVDGDTNGYHDVFVHDRQTSVTTRVSIASNGMQGNNVSAVSPGTSISASGRYVTFASEASNMVSGDTNSNCDIFVHDRQTGVTTRVSAASNGTQANGDSFLPSISPDGRYVTFESIATNLVSGDTNGYKDIFVHEYDTVAPTVIDIRRANGNPTSAANVDFIVIFSETVTGVNIDDFTLSTTGVTGASISSVTGIWDTYTVTVNTGSGEGTIRLDIVDDDTIIDGTGNPLGGIDAGNGDFTTGEVYDVNKTITSTFKSIGAQDGWVLESAETSNKGGALNNPATTLYLGDNAQKKQYRSLLSFSTKDLPDNAVITKVTLKVRKQGVAGGGDPVEAFQGFMLDVKKGFSGSAPGLQVSDFQAKANKSYGPFKPALSGGWYAINLIPAESYINKLTTGGGVTQVRLRFKLDDNNNALANYLKLYSGNAAVASRPQLIVEYYVP